MTTKKLKLNKPSNFIQKLKLKKKADQVEKFELPDVEYPVIIATPVPMIDHRISASLSNFVTAATARRIALPMTVDSRIPETGRNKMIKNFLEDENLKHHTHLMFIDADTIPHSPYAIEKLLVLNKPVVTGITPIGMKRNNRFGMFWNVRKEGEEENLYLDQMPNLPFKVSYCGGSCMMIRRDVLEALESPYMLSEYCDDMIDFRRGEDYYFCDKIRKAGFDIWCDPEVQCHHFHNLDMLDLIIGMAYYAEKITPDGVVEGYKKRTLAMLDEIKELKDQLEELKGVSV